MKTEELIRVLSTGVEPADSRQVSRRIGTAVALGMMMAVGAVLIVSGIRTDIHDLRAIAYLALKLGLASAIVASGSVYLIRLVRPGGEAGAHIAWSAWPLVGVALLALFSLTSAPLVHWRNMAIGDQWLECLVSIPLLAIAPFAMVVWAVRQMAPTDLMRTGALVGLVSGGISAIGYALHCTDDSVLFIALWYGAAIALCTLAGAVLGPRLLRW